MVPQRTVPQASPESIRALHAWLSHSGDFLTHATVREPRPPHRALHATKRVPPFGTILRIPPSHIISSHLAHRTPHVCAVLTSVKSDNVHHRLPDAAGDSAALILFLLAELAAGERSRYHAWLRSLPVRFDNAFTVPRDVVDSLLAGTPLLPLVHVLRDELREMYDEWLVPYAVERDARHYPRARCTWEWFVYVHSIVESRAFKIDDVTMLVPLADMANHRTGGGVGCNAKARGWVVAGSGREVRRIADGGGVEKGLELQATERGVGEGDEVCISYGALANWELLVHYGFAVGRNADDGVEVGLEVPEGEGTRGYMTKMLFLGMGAQGLAVEHRLRRAEPLPAGLVASARLLWLDEEEAAGVSVRGTDFSRRISARNERVVREKLGEVLRQLVERFVERRGGGFYEGYEGFARFCACYVDEQREIVEEALRAVEEG